LKEDAGYWTSGLPAANDIGEHQINDAGVWGQPFSYGDIAHVIVPREFFWESPPGPEYAFGSRKQDIAMLSQRLKERRVDHRMTDLVLEVKLF
jgi:hypothetical protein